MYVNPSGCVSPEAGSQLLSALAYVIMLYFKANQCFFALLSVLIETACLNG